jgi:hypothetical protein
VKEEIFSRALAEQAPAAFVPLSDSGVVQSEREVERIAPAAQAKEVFRFL